MEVFTRFPHTVLFGWAEESTSISLSWTSFQVQASWVSSLSDTYFQITNNFSLTVHTHFLKCVFPFSPPNHLLAHGRHYNEFASSYLSLTKASFKMVSIIFFFTTSSHFSTGVLTRASNSLAHKWKPIRIHIFYIHRVFKQFFSNDFPVRLYCWVSFDYFYFAWKTV